MNFDDPVATALRVARLLEDADLEDASAIIRALDNDVDLATIAREVEHLAAEIEGHDIQQRWRRCCSR